LQVTDKEKPRQLSTGKKVLLEGTKNVIKQIKKETESSNVTYQRSEK
jgi:hypothetical protein